ncbi:hypothetical protein KSS87_007496 [Heliosperma pusillum]|nr:hypothetical protein KSS87_007496 [Heliosperma pusillum]
MNREIPQRRGNRKGRNTKTAQDEIASDEDLFSGPRENVADCGPTTQFSDAIFQPGEYTSLLQYVEQIGQSNNPVDEEVSTAGME